MADKTLSLQALYDLLKTKADTAHTHVFVGSIESALSLNGVTYDKFLRNDLKDQLIKSYNDSVTLSLESNNSKLKLEAGNHRNRIVVGSSDMTIPNLSIVGQNMTDAVVNVTGELLVNESRVLTLNDKGQITGIDISTLDLAGHGIIVDVAEPANTSDGIVWGQVDDDDLVSDSTTLSGTDAVYSLPVGTIIETLSTVVPDGFVRADGKLLDRTIYPALWAFAKTKSLIVSDAAWLSKNAVNQLVESYSTGDGAGTFRVPSIPTSSSTFKLIKAYDNLHVRAVLDVDALAARVDALTASAVVTGVGFIKYGDGTLIQRGTSFGNACLFALPFIDTTYSVVATYVGSSTGVAVSVDDAGRQVNQCSVTAVDFTGTKLGAASAHYVAIGRWK